MDTKKIDDWRTESEYRAMETLKGDMLEECFMRISAMYHEKLHRIKLAIINGQSVR